MNEQIRFLEEIASNGHAALRVKQYDGWLLRFSGGYTGRANSVSPLYPSRKDPADKVAYCEACYARQGLPALFKLTDCDAELFAFLKERGYQVVTPTDVMILDLRQADPAADLRSCVFAEKPGDWLPAWFAFENITDPAKQELFRKILDRTLSDTAYCTLLRDGKPAACAATAAEQGYALLQYVVVDPALRGTGLGEKVCRAALAEAKEQGADYAYLQVVQDNAAALGLYRKLGFRKVYSYCYMRQPR